MPSRRIVITPDPGARSAHLHLMVWQQSGAKIDNQDTRWSWKTIPILYERAAQPPRNPNAGACTASVPG